MVFQQTLDLQRQRQKGGSGEQSPSQPPPPPQLNNDPVHTDPVYLAQPDQPRVVVQVLNNQAISGIDWDTKDQPYPICDSANGPYPARVFEAYPLSVALTKEYEQANPDKKFLRDGRPMDQSWYLTGYSLYNIQYNINDLASSYDQDLELIKGYNFSAIPNIGHRFSKQTPKLLQTSGILKYREQVASSIIMIDGDLCDMFPKSKYPDWYKSQDPTAVEKLPWNPERMTLFENEVLPELLEKEPWLDHCACFYTTENGWRAVFMLDRPVPVLGHHGCAEDITEGMMIRLAAAGVGVDNGCKDWTRLMRVPRCYKGERRIGLGPYFRISWNGVDFSKIDYQAPGELKACDPRALPWSSAPENSYKNFTNSENWELVAKVFGGPKAVEKQGKQLDWSEVDVEFNVGDMPDDEQCLNILYIGGDRRKPSDSYKFVREKLKKIRRNTKQGFYSSQAARLLELIFEDQTKVLTEFAQIHGRDGLHYGNYFATWDLCSILREQLPKPEVIYALLIPSFIAEMAKRAEADPNNARSEDTIRSEAWRAVRQIYPTQIGIQRQRLEEEETEKKAKEAYDKGDEDVRARLDIKDWLAETTGLGLEWAEKNYKTHALLSTPSGTSVMVYADGQPEYTDPASDFSTVFPYIRDSGHNIIVASNIMSEEPTTRKKADLLYDYGTSVDDRVRASRIIDRNKLEYIKEGGRHKPAFVHKLPGVAEDIEPIYNTEVDEYLQLMGGKYYEDLQNWLACFPMIEYPLPALYLQGAPGIGKGMFMAGLEKLTSRKKSANFSDAMGDFQDHYKDTFLISVDEDYEKGDFKKDVVSVLRQIIGGQFNHINIKNVKGIYLEGEWRLVVMANNEDVLEIKKDLSSIDIKALQGRIFYLDCSENSDAMIKFLEEKGGRYGNKSTNKEGTKHWPKYIAQHVMWLHKNRPVEHDSRFLMRPPTTPWHEGLQVKSHGGSILCRAIGELLTMHQEGQPNDAIFVDKVTQEIYIRAPRLDAYLKHNHKEFKGHMARILQRISHGSGAVHKRLHEPGRKARDCERQRVFVINVEAVMTVLQKEGLDIDYRVLFGAEMWENLVPETIKKAVVLEDEYDEPEPPPGSPPPPPPPPEQSVNKVIPFKKYGT